MSCQTEGWPENNDLRGSIDPHTRSTGALETTHRRNQLAQTLYPAWMHLKCGWGRGDISMRTKLVACVLALGVSLSFASSAMAHFADRSTRYESVIMPVKSAAQLYDLARRIQKLEQQGSWRSGSSAKRQLAHIKALRETILGDLPPNERDFNRISKEVERLECGDD
jgi:hypothetical protein